MHNVVIRNRLLTLQQLHLLLKFDPSIQRFCGVPLAPNARNSFLKSQRSLSLLALKHEVGHAPTKDCDSLSGRNIPLESVSPFRIVFDLNIRASLKRGLAPKRQSGVGVDDDNSDVVSFMDTSKVRPELPMGMNINHSFAINSHRQSTPIQISRHLSEPLDNSSTVEEKING